MTLPLVIDFFCCQGGASKGYVDAGFEARGVDNVFQSRYPYTFFHQDALKTLEKMIGVKYPYPVLLHGSPPCQGYSSTQRIQGNDHPLLIAPFRELCIASGLPYIIENVEDAREELIDPITLCGTMIPGLNTYRHRLFESNMPLVAPVHPVHREWTVKMGRPLMVGDWYHAVGNFSGVEYVRGNMKVEWMDRDGIRECIPPTYTEYLGKQVLALL